MARIFKDSSVLNQFGSPSLNSNTFANRPVAGQVGRLFVDTTNNILQRDTGSSWVTIGGGGSTPNLEAVTTIGNTSTQGIFLGASGSLTNGLIFEVSGYSRMQQTVASSTNLGASNIKQFTFQTSGTVVATGNPSPNFNQLFVDIQVGQTVGGAGNLQIGAGLFENVLSGTDNLLLTITQTVGLSALSPIISYQRYINNGDSTITHTAGLVINGLQRTGAGVLNVTNNYQLLINSSQQFSSTSIVTNRWGIYQAGANDYNYFAGSTSINNSLSITNFDDNLLPIIGGLKFYTNQGTQTCYIQAGKRAVAGYKLDIGGDPIIFTNSNLGTEIARFTNNNLLIGTTTNTGRKLVVSGQQEWITTVGTGVYTTSGNHLPIWVNGVQYWLALLN
jgi:hypothetical protein